MNRPAPLVEFTRDLVRRYEEREGTRLSPDEITATFGEERARTLNGLLAGRLPASSSDVIRVIEAIGGDDEEIGTALQFCPPELREGAGPDDAVVLNTRLVRRAADLEQFLRSIDRYEAFRAWRAARED